MRATSRGTVIEDARYGARCGIASSLLYVAATILGAMQWPDYDWTTRSVSELFALDAPSRPLVAACFLAYGVLVLAGGWGIWMSAGRKRGLRVAGARWIAHVRDPCAARDRADPSLDFQLAPT